MHFTLFNFLLLTTSSLLVQDACARPTKKSALVTVPFSRVQRRQGSDSQQGLKLQQHINRMLRRLNRFNNRARSPDTKFRGFMLKRLSKNNDESDVAADSLGLSIEAADVGYYATVQIGTPPRDFNVLMDSGSSDFWVSGEGCQTEKDGTVIAPNCGSNRTIEGASTSSTFVDQHKPWNITYGTGFVSGSIITDNVVIAGLALDGHTFGVGQLESSDFTSDSVPYSGLMGLAKGMLSNQGVPTPPEAMAKKGLIREAIVSYKISRASDGKGDGEITFGGLDDTKFNPSTLVTVDNISKTGFWEAKMGVIAVDGKDTGLTDRTAILDTGTTLVMAPAADAQKVHDAIPGSKSDGMGGFTIPCKSNVTVSMTFGGGEFIIDPRDLVTSPVNADDPTGDCLSGIVADTVSGDSSTQWLVGDVFLKDSYFSTNVDKNTISLARLP